jgi:hypothetical protein
LWYLGLEKYDVERWHGETTPRYSSAYH